MVPDLFITQSGDGSGLNIQCAGEAGVNAGESPVGAIRRFSTADRANCVAARGGGSRHGVEPAGRNEEMNHTNGSGGGQVSTCNIVNSASLVRRGATGVLWV